MMSTNKHLKQLLDEKEIMIQNLDPDNNKIYKMAIISESHSNKSNNDNDKDVFNDMIDSADSDNFDYDAYDDYDDGHFNDDADDYAQYREHRRNVSTFEPDLNIPEMALDQC